LKIKGTPISVRVDWWRGGNLCTNKLAQGKISVYIVYPYISIFLQIHLRLPSSRSPSSYLPEGGNVYHSTYSCTRGRKSVPQDIFLYQKEGTWTTVPIHVPEGGNVYHRTYSCTRKREHGPQFLFLYQKEKMSTTVPTLLPKGGNVPQFSTKFCTRRREYAP
jgi:hypothetical protein